ncbi:MAG TPA: pilus assembly protein PilP [Methylophilaceae bacterium]|nr:pilus assembly protein PilP [Methylophilaceae bacterium]HAJ72050.1 pilus assembly protein PilP [Methylophilaceae bacterium]
MNSTCKWFCLAITLLFLAGCGSGEGDDLDKFMADADKTMSTKVEPLPQVQPYVPIEFNADGKLSDPFKPRKVASNSTFQPNFNRPKEPLESFSLENLKYVGMLGKGKVVYALVKTPDNTVQQVKIGNYLGTNYGLVTAINDNEVVLKEIVQDDLSGDWVERISSLSLQE